MIDEGILFPYLCALSDGEYTDTSASERRVAQNNVGAWLVWAVQWELVTCSCRSQGNGRRRIES